MAQDVELVDALGREELQHVPRDRLRFVARMRLVAVGETPAGRAR
jgi:hypothetical protein